MKNIKFITIFIFLIFISGCIVAFRAINEETFNGIVLGMDQQSVINIAGEPMKKRNKTIEGKDYEVWIYPIERFFAKKYNPFGYLYYEILFLDGKVKEWHRSKVYSQPKYDLDKPEAPEGIKVYKFFEQKQ